MKIHVKTLKNTHFELEVDPEDKIADVKKKIETVHGADTYPAALQMLIHQGKILNDNTTLNESKVADGSFLVIMLTKPKSSPADGSTTSTAPTTKAPQARETATPAPQAPVASVAQPPAVPTSSPSPAPAAQATALSTGDVYGQAASNLLAGENLEGAVQRILDMGGGTWDRDTVLRALRAAFNNPERAVEYLYSGIPEQPEVPVVARPPLSGQSTSPTDQPRQPAPAAAVPSTGPNANPLDLFPQGLPSADSSAVGGGPGGTLDFLRGSNQFRALQSMVQANPQILQPMLQELGKQNPHLMRLIQDHQEDFLSLINEPAEGGEGNIPDLAAMPQAITVTPEERAAIQRLEDMGFEQSRVLQVYFACNKNEELAANYLLDHMHDDD